MPETAEAPATVGSANLFLRVCRVDQEKREVHGVVTTEEVGVDGKVMGFDASCRAFERWHDRHVVRAEDGTLVGGNIREQHKADKPVGAALYWRPDAEQRLIYLGARISRGAQDTWEKILDGTLRGFSINGPIHKYHWQTVQRDARQKRVMWADDYDLDDVSVVDRPGDRPATFAQIVRSYDAASKLVADTVDDGDLDAPELSVLRAEAVSQDESSANEPEEKAELAADEPEGELTLPKVGSEGNEDTTPEVGQDGVTRAASATHAAMSDTHTHEHAAYGAGGDSNRPHNHRHEHGADGAPDASHDHDHADAHAVTRSEDEPATDPEPASTVDFAALRAAIPGMGLSERDQADMIAHVDEAERVSRRDMDPNVGGGVDRDKLKSSDYVFPKTKNFPIVTAGDVGDAVTSWGRYKGGESFDTFKSRLTSVATRKGFESSLPKEWSDGDKKVTRADGEPDETAGADEPETTAETELAQVKAAQQARDIIKTLLVGEATESDEGENAPGGWDVAELAKALEHLENFISSESWEATSKVAAAMRSADGQEEDDLMGAADEILAALKTMQEGQDGIVTRLEKLETGEEERVTRSAEAVRAELDDHVKRMADLEAELKVIGDQPVARQPIRIGDAIPQDKLWPGETPETLTSTDQVIRAAQLMGDEAADPMVRARSQMALVDLLVRHAPEQTLGEPPERQR